MIKSTVTALCGLVLVCVTTNTPAQTITTAAKPQPEAHAGILKSVRGDVRLLAPDGSTRIGKSGDAVAPIDRIVTGPDSGTSVVLRDGTKLVVGPSSRLDLKEFHFDSTTQDGGMLVSLLQGSARMVSGLIGKTHPDAVRVETPTAVIGIRGTDFIVQTDPQP